MFIVYFTANMNLIKVNYSKIVILADFKKTSLLNNYEPVLIINGN